MKKFSLPQILDSLFISFCAFTLIFTTVRFLLKNIIASVICAVVGGIFSGISAFLILGKRQGKRLLSAKDEREKELLAIHLSLLQPQKLKELIIKLLDIHGDTSEKLNIICGQEAIYFLHFSLEKLKLDDIAEAIKLPSDNKKIILCIAADEKNISFANNFLIEVKSLSDIFPLFKDKNLLPKKYIFEGNKKLTAFKKIKSRFNKKLTSPLFFCGLWLTIFSYFTFYPLYYILVGSLLLFLSALTLLISPHH
jgi:hypothetical protein